MVNAPRLETDLLVLGSGMAGMSCAGYAAKGGLRVLLLEKSPDIGGNSLLSGGFLWTAQSAAEFAEHCPNGDQTLGQLLVTNFDNAVDWVRSTGAEVAESGPGAEFGRGYGFNISSYFERCRRYVEAAGGAIAREQFTEQLVIENGAVCGALVRGPDGKVEIRAHATVLATGGFQGSADLRKRFLGPNSDAILLRSRPYSSGDALRLAAAAGAGTAGDMSTFYGRLIAWPIPSFGSDDFRRFHILFSPDCLLLDADCRRFVDESLGDHVANQALAKLKNPRGLLIFDRRVCRDAKPSASHPDQLIQRARESGAHYATASDLATLGAVVTRWGFEGNRISEVVSDFNQQIIHGVGAVPRRWRRLPLTDPPYHALEVKPSVTFTQGGLRVNGDGQVLSQDGGECRGLYAVGADIGGIYNGGYAGGLSLGCVFAMRAATKARGEIALTRNVRRV